MPPDRPCIPLLPLARLWWTLVCCARRNRAAVVAVLVAVIMIAGIGVVATRVPARGCSYRLVVAPGREYWVCERGGE